MAIGNIADLEKSLKLGEGSLQAALDNDESVNIEIPELVIRTPDEDEQLTANMKKEYHTAGREIAIKEARNDMGLDFQGKTMSNLLASYKEYVLKDASVEPDQKNKVLQADLSQVQESLRIQTEEFNSYKTQTKKTESKSRINDQIMGAIEGDFTLGKSDILTLFNAKHNSEFNEDGALQFSKNGNVLKHDTTRNLLSVQDVVTDFTKDFMKKVAPASGNGGTDEAGTTASSMDKFTKEMSNEGHAAGSEAFNREMQKRMVAGTLKL